MKNVKDDTLVFSAVIAEIQTFLEPVFDAILNESEFQNKWNSSYDMWLGEKGGMNNDNTNVRRKSSY